MNLSNEAFRMVAECIARGEYITVELRSEDAEVDVWCDQCRTDSAARVPVQGITEQGVYDLGIVTACALHDLGGDS